MTELNQLIHHPDNLQILIDHLPPAYQSNSPFLLPLVGLALTAYDDETVVALLFCVSRFRNNSLRNLIASI